MSVRRPPANASRSTIRRYYQATQDAALANFLTARNTNPQAVASQSVNQETQDGSRRVRRRVEQDMAEDIAGDRDGPGFLERSPHENTSDNNNNQISDDFEISDLEDNPFNQSDEQRIDNPRLNENPQTGGTDERNHIPDHRHHSPEFPDQLGLTSEINDIQITAEFIKALRAATLDDSNMDKDEIQRLRDAPRDFPFDVEDADFLFAMRTFLAATNTSQNTYNSFRAAALARHPLDPFLSFDQVKRRVEQISGVVPIVHDMCINSCAAFTGPFSGRDTCPICTAPRYDPVKLARTGAQVPQRQFNTIPLGPVLQALYRSPESAAKMQYRAKATKEIIAYMNTHGGHIEKYNDTCCGQDYLDAVRAGRIHDDDIVIQLTFDGAQLYRDKESDCWIYAFLIHNLSPDFRYKKTCVMPGTFVPGPHKPKHPDSYIFPGLYHISALQKEGLRIWDASRAVYIPRSIPFFAFGAADSPAMAAMTGMVGHHGKHGCRRYCDLPGRRRDRDPHYYPVMLKPDNYAVPGCTHDDVTFGDLQRYRKDADTRYISNLQRLVSSRPRDFNSRRLETGLSKPTILSGLVAEHTLGIPNMFVMDMMHLIALNDPDLLLGLWRGTLICYSPDKKDNWDWAVLKGTTWEAHGRTIAAATPYIPSSFDRAPRNPALKINSGYKAWEFLLYIFGLGPALLHHILPEKYWRNYCKLVRGVHILQQREISPAQLHEGTILLCQFVKEFEELYYQRRQDRIHFVRQSIHLLTHIGPETVRAGPLSCYSQWTMETLIGNLGDEIRQDLDPYANISQRGILRAQLNSIRCMVPTLDLNTENKIPKGSVDLGGNYTLLRACQDVATDVTDSEATCILNHWEKSGWPNRDQWTRDVKRWARLRLPNGQVARSHWIESRSSRKLRRTRNVKLDIQQNGKSDFAEVRYFFRLRLDADTVHSLALVSLYSQPDLELLRISSHTVYSCHYQGDASLKVIDVKCIKSVVSMVPYFKIMPDGEIDEPTTEYFLLEKPGLAIAELVGEDDEGEDNLD